MPLAACLALLTCLVWIEAPLLQVDGRAPFAAAGPRWLLIGALLALPALWWVLRLWLARRRDDALAAGVAPAAQPRAGGALVADEVATLAGRMRDALAVLRTANPGWRMRRQYLYELPWYMFVGAPGSGKTTALSRSGLPFPLADALGPQAIGGIGGTRHCDWWFTDDAVLLDTAGRYTTQDSQAEMDHAAWSGFLALLKKYRPRRPINGVIVAVSVADLLQQGQAAREAQARAIRTRIQELQERLGMAFPVYVMVTKSDLLAGFTEFFDSLGREERRQVWGVTFPLPGDGMPAHALKAFPAEFLALEAQLQARLLERLQQERDLARRALLFGFPQQFAALGGVLDDFLRTVFAGNRFEQPALLRGVYFTSGTQQGNPIDRIMASLAASFGLDRRTLPAGPGSGRSYFLARLMGEVIFPEAGLAGLGTRAARRRRLATLGLLAGGAALALLLAAALGTSYLRNQALVQRADAATGALARRIAQAPAGGDELAILPLLDAARALPAGYAARGRPVPLLERMSLYQGEKLGDGAVAAYRRLLRSTLQPRIAARLEDVLRGGAAGDQDLLYETLRVYLMLGQRRYFDAAAVQAWVEADWRQRLPQPGGARHPLQDHLAALLEDGMPDPIPLDAALVAQARLALSAMPLNERLYSRVKRQLAREPLPEVSVNTLLGRDGSGVLARASGASLARGVSGLYSIAGYRRFLPSSARAVAAIARDDWVLGGQENGGGNPDARAAQAAVLQRYYDEYVRAWDGFLADLRPVRLADFDSAARVSNALGGAASPLRAVLAGAARETALAAAGVPGAPAAGQHPVDSHFAPLHRLVAGPAPTPLDQVLMLVKDAALYFDAAASARRSGAPAPSPGALLQLKRAGEGQAAPLPMLLQGIHDAGSGLAQGGERERLDALWQGGPARFCRDAIAGRYPMDRASGRDATPDDFARFFAPGGMLDEFFARELAPFVDRGGARWRWRAAAGPARVSPAALDAFQRGARLRDMFFAGGATVPSLRFTLRPLAADPGLAALTLEIDGQAVPASRGQAGQAGQAVALAVSGGKGNGLVRFTGVPATAAELRTEGPWAWLRMVDRGTAEPLQAERFRLGFSIDGRRGSYELTAGSVINPYRREATQFACPPGL